MKRKTKLLAALTAGVVIAGTVASADTFPAQPIQLNVCSPAGGGNDQNAQALAPFINKYLGVQGIVQYKPGAGGTLAASEVAHAAPDGYTLLICDMGGTVYGPIAQNLDLDGTSLVPVAQLTFVPWILTAAGDAPWEDVDAFIAAAAAAPGTIDAAISDIASADHYAWLRLAQESGLGAAGLRWIPYGGGGPKVRAMLAGESQIDMLLPALISEHVAAGTMKPLAVAAAERIAALPEVPTFAELGHNVVEGLSIGVFAPAGISDEALATLRAGFAQIAADPEYQAVYTNLGQDIAGFMDGDSYQPLWDETWTLAPDLLRAAAGAN